MPPRVEVTDSGKHTSLFLLRINYDRKKFYSADPAYFRREKVNEENVFKRKPDIENILKVKKKLKK
jgi:hypothetical protein